MLVHKERVSGTVASGALTLTTGRLQGGLCRQIYANPATASTSYSITIRDDAGDTVYAATGQTGRLDQKVTFPVRGVYTIAFTSVSADEVITAFLGVQEE